MTLKEKNSLPFLSTFVFCIVGRKRLHNELLASYLHQKTGYKCFIYNKITQLSKNHKNPRLVMIDCQTNDIENMMIELKMYNKRKQGNNHTILFNVPINIKFQKQFIMHGIHGLVYDYDSIDNFIKGIYSVIKGKLWFSREIMSSCILEETENEIPAKYISEKLSQRQLEILSLIAVGASNREISEKLFISPHTVKNHLYNIFKKIGVSNRIQASLWAAINL